MKRHTTLRLRSLLPTIVLASTIWLCTSCRTASTSTAASTSHTTSTSASSASSDTQTASTSTTHLTTDTLTVTAAAMETLLATFPDSGGVATFHPDGTLTLRGLRSLRRDRSEALGVTASHREVENTHDSLTASASHVATEATEETTETTETPTSLPRWPFILASLLTSAAIALWLLRPR